MRQFWEIVDQSICVKKKKNKNIRTNIIGDLSGRTDHLTRNLIRHVDELGDLSLILVIKMINVMRKKIEMKRIYVTAGTWTPDLHIKKTTILPIG